MDKDLIRLIQVFIAVIILFINLLKYSELTRGLP